MRDVLFSQEMTAAITIFISAVGMGVYGAGLEDVKTMCIGSLLQSSGIVSKADNF